ncbi:MAG: hypothetical protein ABL958_14360 [Bdellovibrionia bacterium]
MKKHIVILSAAALLLGGIAVGGTLTETAFRRLDNVIYTYIPAQYRPNLQRASDQARRDLSDLQYSIERLDTLANYDVPAEYRKELNDRIREVKTAIGAELVGGDVQPTGQYFCAVACRNYTGNPDMSFVAGGKGNSKLVAQQVATDNLKKTYNCNYGPIDVGCEPQSGSSQSNTCQYACLNYTGVPDKAFTAIGQGASKLEASINAINGVKAKYNCNYGIGKVACE